MLIIVGIILIIICSFAAYKIGYNKIKVQQVKADKVKERYIYKLEYKKNELEDLINAKNNTLEVLDNVCAEKQKYIDNAEKLAKENYKLKDEQLSKEHQEKIEKLIIEYNLKQEQLQQNIQEIEKELSSLQNTKAATIEAFRKEKAIQEQKDLYRLNINEQDQNDIKFLRSIQYRISKPRLISMLIWQNYFQPLAKQKFPLILGKDKVCGIYKITNTFNEMCYIGQARDMRDRWNQHCKKGLGIDTPQGNKLYAAMLEDGLENFTFELLLECEPEELDKQERYFIKLYNAVDFGYNSKGGNR